MVEANSRLVISQIAEAHRADGRHVSPIAVNTKTLAEVAHEHVRRPVHFLKIDVEGNELKVIRGADFSSFRPWILLIEASPERYSWNRRVGLSARAETLDSVLGEAGYHFVYFDGLNRFYVADERMRELEPAFFDAS